MDAAFPINAQAKLPEVSPLAAAGTGRISMFLRAEALIEFALAVAAYRYVGGSWLTFAVLLLVPDVSMVGYFATPRIGARLYNLCHTYVAPALLAGAGVMVATPLLYSLALIWAAHIGFDRVLGFGLKYPAAFGATHLSARGGL